MIIKRLLIILIRVYKKAISPYIPPACRYQPTCSLYTVEAIERFGSFKGLGIGFIRILSCNPFFKAGPDPVPDNWPGWGSYIKERFLRSHLTRVKPPDREDDDIGSDNEYY